MIGVPLNTCILLGASHVLLLLFQITGIENYYAYKTLISTNHIKI